MRFRARTPAAAATIAASGTAPHPPKPKRRKARIAAPEEVTTAPFAAEVSWGVVALWGVSWRRRMCI